MDTYKLSDILMGEKMKMKSEEDETYLWITSVLNYIY